VKSILGGAAAVLAFAAAPAAHAGALLWSGDVDDTATITIHRQDIRIDSNMKGVRGERHDLRGAITRRTPDVRLRVREGRGRVRVIQQPRRWNDYTAVVRIEDKDSGRGHYEFALMWPEDDWGGRDRWNDRDGDRGRYDDRRDPQDRRDRGDDDDRR